VDIKDNTLKSLDIEFEDSYGSGAVGGVVYSAPLSLSGIQVDINVGMAQYLQGFASLEVNGLLGLAFKSLNNINVNYFSSFYMYI
jgi:hypothetical protein